MFDAYMSCCNGFNFQIMLFITAILSDGIAYNALRFKFITWWFMIEHKLAIHFQIVHIVLCSLHIMIKKQKCDWSSLYWWLQMPLDTLNRSMMSFINHWINIKRYDNNDLSCSMHFEEIMINLSCSTVYSNIKRVINLLNISFTWAIKCVTDENMFSTNGEVSSCDTRFH